MNDKPNNTYGNKFFFFNSKRGLGESDIRVGCGPFSAGM